MSMLFNRRSLLNKINALKQDFYVRTPEMFIFGSYLIWWGFILVTSYYYYPVEFDLMKYFITNIMIHLCTPNDFFNLIGVQSKTILINILLKFIICK